MEEVQDDRYASGLDLQGVGGMFQRGPHPIWALASGTSGRCNNAGSRTAPCAIHLRSWRRSRAASTATAATRRPPASSAIDSSARPSACGRNTSQAASAGKPTICTMASYCSDQTAPVGT
ncbi:hypothetical protein G6F46_015420 [Rhizopus delemar]|nr:hypothetical protein G6F46_015420 [Rhizopus delemar]